MTISQYKKHWGVDQWAAFLSAQVLPCMPRSKLMVQQLEASREELLSPKELAEIAGSDPFLCLRLLREAEGRRVQRLGHETTTPLAAVMQLGTDVFRELLLASPETDETNPGLAECEARSFLAAHLALRWGSARADLSPDELALAALLAEMGELLLWSYAPELPAAASNELASGRASRSQLAQLQACGFRFKDLTLKCAETWRLPQLVTQLIRGIDNHRANLSRQCVDTARHFIHDIDNPALPHDLAEAQKLIPGVSLAWLAEGLPGISEEQIALLVARTEEFLNHQHAA